MANTPARSPPPKLIVVSSRRVAQPLVHLLPSHTVKRSTTRGRAARRLTDVVAYRLGTDECAVGGPRPYATDPVPESERCVETTVRGQGDTMAPRWATHRPITGKQRTGPTRPPTP